MAEHTKEVARISSSRLVARNAVVRSVRADEIAEHDLYVLRLRLASPALRRA